MVDAPRGIQHDVLPRGEDKVAAAKIKYLMAKAPFQSAHLIRNDYVFYRVGKLEWEFDARCVAMKNLFKHLRAKVAEASASLQPANQQALPLQQLAQVDNEENDYRIPEGEDLFKQGNENADDDDQQSSENAESEMDDVKTNTWPGTFQNRQEYEAAAFVVCRKGTGPIPTRQFSEEEERQWAERIFNAMINVENAEGNKKTLQGKDSTAITRMSTGYYADEAIEAVSWSLLCDGSNLQEGQKLDPRQEVTEEYETLEERLLAIIAYLSTYKTMCQHLMNPQYETKLITAPRVEAHTTLANIILNAKRGYKNQIAKGLLQKDVEDMQILIDEAKEQLQLLVPPKVEKGKKSKKDQDTTGAPKPKKVIKPRAATKAKKTAQPEEGEQDDTPEPKPKRVYMPRAKKVQKSDQSEDEQQLENSAEANTKRTDDRRATATRAQEVFGIGPGSKTTRGKKRNASGEEKISENVPNSASLPSSFNRPGHIGAPESMNAASSYDNTAFQGQTDPQLSQYAPNPYQYSGHAPAFPPQPATTYENPNDYPYPTGYQNSTGYGSPAPFSHLHTHNGQQPIPGHNPFEGFDFTDQDLEEYFPEESRAYRNQRAEVSDRHNPVGPYVVAQDFATPATNGPPDAKKRGWNLRA